MFSFLKVLFVFLKIETACFFQSPIYYYFYFLLLYLSILTALLKLFVSSSFGWGDDYFPIITCPHDSSFTRVFCNFFPRKVNVSRICSHFHFVLSWKEWTMTTVLWKCYFRVGWHLFLLEPCSFNHLGLILFFNPQLGLLIIEAV